MTFSMKMCCMLGWKLTCKNDEEDLAVLSFFYALSPISGHEQNRKSFFIAGRDGDTADADNERR